MVKKQVTWFDKWCKFMRSLDMNDRADLYLVLAGLRGPDTDFAGEVEDFVAKLWSWRIRWVMGWGDPDLGRVLPKLKFKGVGEGWHYVSHVEGALDVLGELEVI